MWQWKVFRYNKGMPIYLAGWQALRPSHIVAMPGGKRERYWNKRN